LKVLIIGNGGREHVIAWKLARSPLVTQIFCSPGNGGTAAIATNLSLTKLTEIVAWAEREQIDLTVVGPEAYLAEGAVDLFQERGLPVYGPSRLAARLESSKAFAKDFMKRYQIPTAKYEVFSTAAAARDYLKTTGAPAVIKADGLAAGKGVVVALDLETALRAVDAILTDRIFGESGAKVVIEEYLEGEEASLLAFCDGKKAAPMPAAQDHKRIGDGDVGPNTGGMGAYAPTTAVTPEIKDRIVKEILDPTIKAMADEGTPFVGTLYLGLMLTAAGPKVIEYNVRFGDPETQAILPLLESDLAEVLRDAAAGELDTAKIRWKNGWTTVCVVAASGGYPGKYETGKVITGLGQLREALVFHAGTKLNDAGAVVTAGGRVLNLVMPGRSIAEAVAGAYREMAKVNFDGICYRRDIAKRELERVR